LRGNEDFALYYNTDAHQESHSNPGLPHSLPAKRLNGDLDLQQSLYFLNALG